MKTTLTDSFQSGSTRVPWEVLMPASAAAPCPAALVLHGSFGLLPPYRADMLSFAQALAARGIAALLPHYLEATATEPGIGVFELIASLRPTWLQVCSDALAAMARDPRFDSTHLGLLGFSLGANLALGVAMEPPAGTAPKCVVDFFGPTLGLPSHAAALPPLLILHGSDDSLVAPSESERLVAALEAAGKRAGRDYRCTVYAGQGHGFKGAALAKSRDEAVEFIVSAI